MIDDDSTVGDVKAFLRDRWYEGVDCPACTQRVQVYKRPLSSVGARTMILMWRQAPFYAPVHVPSLLAEHAPDIAHQGGYATLGQHWGLMVEAGDLRPDGGRAGWWCLTERGDAFIHGRASIPRRAHLYNGRCIGHAGEDQVTVHAVLGQHFALDRLLAGRA